MITLIRSLAASVIIAGLLTPSTLAQTARPTAEFSAHPSRDAGVPAKVRRSLGIEGAKALRLDVRAARRGEAMRVTLPIEGVEHTIDLTPRSVRGARYRVAAVGAEGEVTHAPRKSNTFVGTIVGRPGARVSGALVDGGLVLDVQLDDGRHWAVEPLRRLTGRATAHALFPAEAAARPGHGCGVTSFAAAPAGPEDDEASGAPMALGGIPDVAELACDADFDYFSDYASVGDVEDRINAIVNQVNLQFESQVDVTHVISVLFVRTSPTYTSTDADDLVNEFRNYWFQNHALEARDCAQLFTGKNIDGSTIGIALTVGSICEIGGYSVVQSDFSGSFAFVTDLTAHELGHLWGAQHCTCSNNTMNPIIVGANHFSPASIAAMIAHRDTRTCLNESSAVYCSTSGGDPNFEYISNVNFGTINKSSGASSYSDFTAESTEVERGQSVNLTVTLGSAFSSDIGAAWIDWNGDKDFDDEGEMISTGWSGTGPYVTTADVPITAALGSTRMRIRVQDSFANPTAQPCGNTSFGEAEDYSVVILPVPPPPCPTDLDDNGVVDFIDLLEVLSGWGPCAGCPADIDGNGTIDFVDLLEVLSAWGDCP